MKLTTLQIILLIIVLSIILLTQATWIFLDARKRNEKYYWLWGMFGLLNCPQSLLVYLIVTRVIKKRFKKH